MAKAPPAFQFYPDVFEQGTANMTLAEVGGYMRLLNAQWAQGSIPGDDAKRLAVIMRCPLGTALRVWTVVQDKFVRWPDGGWRNARMEHERLKQVRFREAQADNGKLGGRPPAGEKPSLLSGLTQTEPKPNPNETPPSPSLEHKSPPKSSRWEDFALTAELKAQISAIVSGFSAEQRYSARAFHDAVAAAFEEIGWKVVREHHVDDRGDGRAGLVDLLVATGPRTLAIELDRRTPRQKSLDKLRVLAREGYAGVVVCRVGERFSWRQQGEIAIYAASPPSARAPLPDPWQQQERMAEMRRLMADGLSYADAQRKAFG